MNEESQIRKAVKDRYAQLAFGVISACGTACCSTVSNKSVPEEASRIAAGSGFPVDYANLKEGMVVVDLGSGGGVDVFRASKLVGATGKVIGIDSTPEMIWRARETAQKHSYRNVEFRLGEIEHMPLESDSVDVAISNCVINLVPDKREVFKEVYRVLKPGGRLVISDIVPLNKMPEDLKKSLDNWSRCLSGALQEEEYFDAIQATGFRRVKVKEKHIHRLDSDISHPNNLQFASITIVATKPQPAE
ncbi:MAG: arsenite methyltransferase [Nitrososphaerales archaeon]